MKLRFWHPIALCLLKTSAACGFLHLPRAEYTTHLVSCPRRDSKHIPVS